MAKLIKKHKELALILGIGLFIAIAGMLGMYNMFPSNVETVEAATTANVSVTATVQEWISLTASSTATLAPDLVDTSGNTAIASSTTGLTFISKSNSADGYTVTVTGANNGLNGSISGTIASVADGAATGITAGTDGYGIQATSSESTVDTYYNNWGNNTLGSIRTGGQSMVDSAGPTDADGHSTSFRIAAACDANQQSGTYTDTVTLTITAAP
ncbi:MAG: hypothetical protein ABH919_00610 [bacterium]